MMDAEEIARRIIFNALDLSRNFDECIDENNKLKADAIERGIYTDVCLAYWKVGKEFSKCAQIRKPKP